MYVLWITTQSDPVPSAWPTSKRLTWFTTATVLVRFETCQLQLSLFEQMAFEVERKVLLSSGGVLDCLLDVEMLWGWGEVVKWLGRTAGVTSSCRAAFNCFRGWKAVHNIQHALGYYWCDFVVSKWWQWLEQYCTDAGNSLILKIYYTKFIDINLNKYGRTQSIIQFKLRNNNLQNSQITLMTSSPYQSSLLYVLHRWRHHHIPSHPDPHSDTPYTHVIRVRVPTHS